MTGFEPANLLAPSQAGTTKLPHIPLYLLEGLMVLKAFHPLLLLASLTLLFKKAPAAGVS